MMFRKHRVSDVADLYLDPAVVYPCDFRNMFFVACVHCVGDKFLHLLSAANDRNL
jgi:hypothetical protein